MQHSGKYPKGANPCRGLPPRQNALLPIRDEWFQLDFDHN